jgi:hypothetical protein
MTGLRFAGLDFARRCSEINDGTRKLMYAPFLGSLLEEDRPKISPPVDHAQDLHAAGNDAIENDIRVNSNASHLKRKRRVIPNSSLRGHRAQVATTCANAPNYCLRASAAIGCNIAANRFKVAPRWKRVPNDSQSAIGDRL